MDSCANTSYEVKYIISISPQVLYLVLGCVSTSIKNKSIVHHAFSSISSCVLHSLSSFRQCRGAIISRTPRPARKRRINPQCTKQRRQLNTRWSSLPRTRQSRWLHRRSSRRIRSNHKHLHPLSQQEVEHIRRWLQPGSTLCWRELAADRT